MTLLRGVTFLSELVLIYTQNENGLVKCLKLHDYRKYFYQIFWLFLNVAFSKTSNSICCVKDRCKVSDAFQHVVIPAPYIHEDYPTDGALTQPLGISVWTRYLWNIVMHVERKLRQETNISVKPHNAFALFYFY